MSPLVAITIYMVVQLGIGVWISRRIRTETDYILAGRSLGYLLATFSIFATWFGAETIVGSAGRAYRDGVSLGSAEPFGYALCLILMGLIFAGPLWRRKLTTIADLYRERFSPAAERLAAVVLIPGSILWASAQIRAFGHVITASSADVNADLAIAIAAGFTILYSAFGGLLVDAITDLIQGVILVLGIVVLFVAVIASAGSPSDVAQTLAANPSVQLVPRDASVLELLERWAIPVGGSVLATELIGRVIATRTARVAQVSSLTAGALYLVVGTMPLILGVLGPQIAPGLADEEQLLPHIARGVLPTIGYAVFAGAVISAILSTVDSTLLTSSALLSHNLLVPMLRLRTDRQKLLVARLAVLSFGVVAYALASRASGVYELVEQASSFGSAGALVTITFGLFTRFGGGTAAIASLGGGLVSYIAAVVVGSEIPFLISLASALASYVLVAIFSRRQEVPSAQAT